MHSLPYIDTKKNTSLPLLIVSPIKPVQKETEGGLVIPEGVGQECQQGTVYAAGINSTFKKGDIVTYKLIDRTQKGNFEEFQTEGQDYDIIAETEVWDVNDVPFGRVFVQPLSSFDVAMGGLVIPDKVKGIPQKGRVVRAPANYFCKEGDTVEYRPNEKRIYREAVIDRITCHVVFEPDIYTINGLVSPHRVIVKIDIGAQRIKRNTTYGGLALSPLFVDMKHNLQYGEIFGIGSEAQKHYPEMKVGDTAIFNHSVEAHPHRLLWEEAGKISKVLYEYRMIECWNPNAREIFGRIDRSDKKNKIVPYGKCIFLDWDIELFEQKKVSVVDADFSLDKCKDIDDLRNTIHHKTREAAENFQKKFNGYSADMQFFAFDNPDDREKIELTGRKIDQLKVDALRIAQFIKKNHLLKCRVVFAPQLPVVCKEVVLTYKELYPIDIMGKRYLIGHTDYLTAFLNTDTNMSTLERLIPIADQVLVQPIIEENTGGLVIAEEAKEKPQTGLAIAVGIDVNPLEIQPGYIVHYRKRTGVEMEVDGVSYLMLRRNGDIFAGIKPLEAEVISAD